MNRHTTPTTNVADAVTVTALCFGWFIMHSIGAVASGFPTRQIDDASFFGLILLELILGTAALCFLRFRGHDLVPLVPIPTAVGCAIGLALYAVAMVATWPLYLVIGPSNLATQPINQMVAGASISLPSLVAVSIVNGFYEETFLLGYLLRALENLGASFAIGATVLIRVLYHLYQGPVGTISVLGFGVVLAIYFWRTRMLWPVVFAHIFADVAGFSLS